MFLKRLNLLQKFSILSLLGIGILVLSLSYLLSYLITQNMVDMESKDTAEWVRMEVRDHSLLPFFSRPFKEVTHLRKGFRRFINLPEVFRIKVYDRKGTIIWSNEEALIGRAFPDNKELQEALQGKTLANIRRATKAEQIYERRFKRVMEIYAPIFSPETREILGVVELYKFPVDLFQRIRRGKNLIWLFTSLGGLFLYLSLFWIVRGSYRSQLRLEEDVRKYSRDLEDKVKVLKELYCVSLAMQEPMTLNERLEFILKGAHEVLGLDRINILLPDKEMKMLQSMASVGNVDEPLDRIKVPLDERGGGLALAFKEKREVSWDGSGPVPEGLRLAYPYSEIKAFRSKNFLILPLVSRGKPIGVIGADNKFSQKAISQETIEILRVFAYHAAIAIENARLFERERQKVQESKAIMEIQRDIIEELDLERLLPLIIRRASELLKANSGTVYLYDEAHQVCRPKAWYNVGEWIRDVEIPLGRGVTGTAALEKRGIIANDYPNSPYAIPPFLEHSIWAAISHPLIIKDKVTGVITINDANIGRAFTQDDLELLDIFASQASIAIENARLFEKELKRSQELAGLIKVGQAVSSTLNLDDVLRSIVVLAAQVMAVPRCNLMLLDEKGEYLEWRAFIGLPEEMAQIGRTRVSESLAGIVASQGTPLAVLDMASDPRAANRGLHRKYGSVSYLGVPIRVKEKTTGVLNIYTKQPHDFSEEEIELLSTFADQAGIAIENARLYQDLKEYSLSLEEKVRERTRELEEANIKLEKASSHKSEFLANMSHELRTPLNSILGFSEVLQDLKFGDLNEKQAKYVSNILISGKHLLQLINDVLDLSKVEAGRMELKPQKFSLAQALEDSLTIIRSQADSKHLCLDLEVEGNISITADPVRFKQIMYNLLSNAVKFTPVGGKVSVAARVRSQEVTQGLSPELRTTDYGQFVQISVSDTGIGIKKEDQERVFYPFQQVDGSLARRFEGTGLGLALTRQFVEMHMGRIWVESEGEGKGSKFSFLLPLRQDAP